MIVTCEPKNVAILSLIPRKIKMLSITIKLCLHGNNFQINM